NTTMPTMPSRRLSTSSHGSPGSLACGPSTARGSSTAKTFAFDTARRRTFPWSLSTVPSTSLLSDLARSIRPRARRPGPTVDIDAGWAELKEQCPELDLDLGSGTTLYNFYAPIDGREVLLIGVFR